MIVVVAEKGIIGSLSIYSAGCAVAHTNVNSKPCVRSYSWPFHYAKFAIYIMLKIENSHNQASA